MEWQIWCIYLGHVDIVGSASNKAETLGWNTSKKGSLRRRKNKVEEIQLAQLEDYELRKQKSDENSKSYEDLKITSSSLQFQSSLTFPW